jgi:hypothetical protein
MPDVSRPKSLRYQVLDLVSDNLFVFVPEQGGHLPVGK